MSIKKSIFYTLAASVLFLGINPSTLGEVPIKVDKEDSLPYPQNSEKLITKIAFSSCSKQDQDQPLWRVLLEAKPDVMLMIGDNIYADTKDPLVFEQKYRQLGSQPDFIKVRQSIPFLATWDDHDYGANDGGLEFEAKEISKAAFLRFWGLSSDKELLSRPGIYHSRTFGPPGKRIQFILLDTRFFRGPLTKTEAGYVPNNDPLSSYLGSAQWKWLESEFKKPADLRILVSSVQLIPNEHRYEKWGNLPLEKNKLFNLIRKSKISNLMILSGDRHHGEISKLPASQWGGSFDLYEITASGMTEKEQGSRPEKNKWRIGADQPFIGNQFGELIIRWTSKQSPFIEISIKDQARNTVSASDPIKM